MCSAGCFGDGIKLKGQVVTSGFFIMKSEDMPCQVTTFHIRMIAKETVSSGSGTIYAEDIEMKVFNTFKPDIDILCQKNCAPKVNPSRRFVQVAECTNCWNKKQRESISYRWEISVHGNPVELTGHDEHEHEDDGGIIGVQEAALIIAENVMVSSQDYAFTVTGSNRSEMSQFLSWATCCVLCSCNVQFFSAAV